MALRAGKWTPRSSEPMNLHQRLQGTGFVILGEVPDKELVSAWRGNFKWLSGGVVRDSPPNNILGVIVPTTPRKHCTLRCTQKHPTPPHIFHRQRATAF